MDGCKSSRYESDKFWEEAGFDVTGIGDVLARFLSLLEQKKVTTLNLLWSFTLEDIVASSCLYSVTNSSSSEARGLK